MDKIKTAKDTMIEWANRNEIHVRQSLSAYYYGFDFTGNPAIDAILGAVADAGKCYHDTSDWCEKTSADYIPIENIQKAANLAAILNTAADQSRVIEELTCRQTGFIAALATIQTTLQNSHIQNNKHRMGILGEEDVDYAVRVASEVLAEAARIMEGK